MKLYVLAIAMIIPMFFSCRKEVGIKIPVHDTTVIRDTVQDTVHHHDTINNSSATVIGTWESVNPSYGNIDPTFDREYMSVAHGPQYRYLCSSDSIYARYTSGEIALWYYYKLWPTNDTLELTLITTLPQPTKKFYRVH